MQPNLNQIHQLVLPAVNQASRLAIDKFSKTKKISYKPGSYDHLGTSIVTDVDQKIETLLKAKFGRILPGSGFIGEESPAEVKDYNWIIDPIDGTLNYANHLPNFCISVALWHLNQPIYSIVSTPLMSETVHAISGQGIWLNGAKVKPIKIDPENKLFLANSIVGPAEVQQRVYRNILSFTTTLRTYGSCVFHGVNMALGRIGGGVFINQALWDIGAIGLLAQEAGLTVKYISPKPNLAKDNLKNYQYSLVIGSKKLVIDLAAKL